MQADDLRALIERVERAKGPDRELDAAVHEALGWVCRRVTRLGLNGRTPGRYLWFEPGATYKSQGRRHPPQVSGKIVKRRVLAALRARLAMMEDTRDA